MNAAQYYGTRDVRIEQIPIPRPGAGDVLVKVQWCGICGSDLKVYLDNPFVKSSHTMPESDTLPFTLGHEFCGRIASIGDGESSLSEGQAVIVDPRLYCSSCETCSNKDTNLCSSDKSGIRGMTKRAGGGLAEYAVVAAKQCYPIPDDLLDVAALIEPLAVARRSLRQAMVEDWSDKIVLVLGGGPIGQATICNLIAAGCTTVFCSEPAKVRIRQVKQLGAKLIDPTQDDVVEVIMSETVGSGVHVVFDCAGVQPACTAGMLSLRRQGVYILLASWNSTIELEFSNWLVKEITLRSSMAYNDDDFKSVVEDFIRGRFLGVDAMVTARVKLENVVKDGLETLLTQRDTCVKVLVTPS